MTEALLVTADGAVFRGESVGADDQISKPEIHKMAEKVIAAVKAEEE